MLFTILYAWVIADESGALQTEAAVIGYLAGLLIAAAVAGWLGARCFAAVWTRSRVHH